MRSLSRIVANNLAGGPGISTIGCYTLSRKTLEGLSPEALLSLAAQSGYGVEANPTKMDRRSYTTIDAFKTLDMVIQKEPLIITLPDGCKVEGDDHTLRSLLLGNRDSLMFNTGNPFFKEKLRPRDSEHRQELLSADKLMRMRIVPDSYHFYALLSPQSDQFFLDKNIYIAPRHLHLGVRDIFPELNDFDGAVAFTGVVQGPSLKPIYIDDLLYFKGKDYTYLPLPDRTKALPRFLYSYGLDHYKPKYEDKNSLSCDDRYGMVIKDRSPYAVKSGKYIVENWADIYYLGVVEGGKGHLYQIREGEFKHTGYSEKIGGMFNRQNPLMLIKARKPCTKPYDRDMSDVVITGGRHIVLKSRVPYHVSETYAKLKFPRK